MIETRRDLKNCLAIEKCLYTPAKFRDSVLAVICNDFSYELWKYICTLRKSELHFNNCSFRKSGIVARLHDIAYVYYRWQRNRQGKKLGLEIYENNFEPGLCIYHAVGGVLMNGYARVGKNCKLHGNNCIGNKGISQEVPVIGDNVDIGFGASVIGGVTIGDNVIIAAGSVVTHSFPKGNVVLAGVPACILKENRL